MMSIGHIWTSDFCAPMRNADVLHYCTSRWIAADRSVIINVLLWPDIGANQHWHITPFRKLIQNKGLGQGTANTLALQDCHGSLQEERDGFFNLLSFSNTQTYLHLKNGQKIHHIFEVFLV